MNSFKTLVAWQVAVADLWHSLKLILGWPYCLLPLLSLGCICLLSCMSCAYKSKVVLSMNIAMTCDMSPTEELILVFVAKGNMWTQRVLLVYSIDASCIMNLGSANYRGSSFSKR